MSINDYKYYWLLIDNKLFDTFYKNTTTFPLSKLLSDYVLKDIYDYSVQTVQMDYTNTPMYNNYGINEQIEVLNERIDELYHDLIDNAEIVGVPKTRYYTKKGLKPSDKLIPLNKLL